jgi:hypothetical protein
MRLLLSALVVLAGVLTAAPTPALAADFCSPGQAPRFQLGFATLAQQLGPIMGTPSECEHPNAANGDTLQHTTTGLAFYRKATNIATFTDGYNHWGLTPVGIIRWTGSSVDPPGVAGAAGAAPTRPAAPSSYEFPTIGPPGDPAKFTCLERNPSCNRDPWWMEWNELQESNPVQYRFVEPGFTTEARYIEAVWLIWQWPEGQELLKDAGSWGVLVTTAPASDSGPFASYRRGLKLIRLNGLFTQSSTWMVADVLAHELKHASDDKAGLFVGNSFSDCITREQRAYSVEQRFLRWVAGRFGGLPSESAVAASLSSNDLDLYENLATIARAPDVNQLAFEDYQAHC